MTISEARELVKRYTKELRYEPVVSQSDAYSIVEAIVSEMQTEIDKLTKENAQMAAKIFAYEAILQNSNFKMAVVRKKKEEE